MCGVSVAAILYGQHSASGSDDTTSMSTEAEQSGDGDEVSTDRRITGRRPASLKHAP